MRSDIPEKKIIPRIFLVGGLRVMLDSDLAKLYGVETKSLNRAVRRNENRFPSDFMFQLSEGEHESLRRQIGTSIESFPGRGGRRYLPFVFTEQGVAMLSCVLKSERAVLVNIEIMRAFVKLREFLLTNEELASKLNDLEKKYDSRFREIFEALRSLMYPPVQSRRKIGIRSDSDD